MADTTTDFVERRILERDVQVAGLNDEDRSICCSMLNNYAFGIIRACTFAYCLLVSSAHFLLFNSGNLEVLRALNIIMELSICFFVAHDCLAAGGWMPGVSNSLWLSRFAELIPYHAKNQYFTSIPKNYLRGALFLFIASITDTNSDQQIIEEARILNVPMLVFGVLFIAIGYFGGAKKMFRSYYMDWILEKNVDYDSKRLLSFEKITIFGWVSLVFNMWFFLYIIAAYAVIIFTDSSLPVYLLIACIAKCAISLLILCYLLIHRRVYTQLNWASFFILFFSLNCSLNLLYEFNPDIPLNEYCIYVWIAALVIEIIRVIFLVICYFGSMYRYYTPFPLFLKKIRECIHFWIVKQGITKFALVLILFALPFLIRAFLFDWYYVDFTYTPFFEYDIPLDIKYGEIKEIFDNLIDILEDITGFLDVVDDIDAAISDTAMCIALIGAFAAIVGASIFPGASSAAAAAYQTQRVLKFFKRIVDLFNKIRKALDSMLAKIKLIMKKIWGMRKKVKELVRNLESITSIKTMGSGSIWGLVGLLIIPMITVIIGVWICVLDRSHRFNSLQISATTSHKLWISFAAYLILLNGANWFLISSLYNLFDEMFVFETVVFSASVNMDDGYTACMTMHMCIIVGLALFMLDRLIILGCGKRSFYTQSPDSQCLMHSYCKAKADTPSVQACLQYLVEYYQWEDTEAESMSFDDMSGFLMSWDELSDENEAVREILVNVCWSCLEYNKFDESSKIIGHKEWEYFLTSYKIGSFPWTQPAQKRKTENYESLKASIENVFASQPSEDEDMIELIEGYTFNEAAQKEVATLSVEGCKQILLDLRTMGHDESKLNAEINENDVGIKVFLNMSKEQLKHLLSRFDVSSWDLISALDTIYNEDLDIYAPSSPKGRILSQSDHAQSIEMSEQVLPDGWRRIVNNEGLVYYHHDESGQTQWELPTKKNDDEKIEEEEEEVLEPVAELPTDWQEIRNDEGLVYYHNATKGKTQWKRPSLSLSKVVDAESDEEKETEGGDDDALPEDWRRMTTSDGTAYYHNEKSQKTQWEKPKRRRAQTDKIVMKSAQKLNSKKSKSKSIETQTPNLLNGCFGSETIYRLFFDIASKDLSLKRRFKRHEVQTPLNQAAVSDRITDQWVKMNEVLVMTFNRRPEHHEDDDEEEEEEYEYKEQLTASEAIELFDDSTKYNQMIKSAKKEHEMADAQQWFAYLDEALSDYDKENNAQEMMGFRAENPNARDPAKSHYQSMIIYVILFVGLVSFMIYNVAFMPFMSLAYNPIVPVTNAVSGLVKAKETLFSEMDIEQPQFDGYREIFAAGNKQAFSCDIGSIFTLIPGSPFSKFQFIDDKISQLLDKLNFLPISIEDLSLLDEINAYLPIPDINITGIDIENIDLETGIPDIEFDVEAPDVSFPDFELRFPMVDIMTWPSIDIPFKTEWFGALLIPPITCLIVVIAVFFFNALGDMSVCFKKGMDAMKKKEGFQRKSVRRAKEVKTSIAAFVMLSGMTTLMILVSLGSIISTVSKYLPNSTVIITFEQSYFNLILSCGLMELLGLLLYIDVFTGEHIPLLGNIFKKEKKVEKKKEEEEEQEYYEEQEQEQEEEERGYYE